MYTKTKWQNEKKKYSGSVNSENDKGLKDLFKKNKANSCVVNATKFKQIHFVLNEQKSTHSTSEFPNSDCLCNYAIYKIITF